jgi:hypothetical protein
VAFVFSSFHPLKLLQFVLFCVGIRWLCALLIAFSHGSWNSGREFVSTQSPLNCRYWCWISRTLFCCSPLNINKRRQTKTEQNKSSVIYTRKWSMVEWRMFHRTNEWSELTWPNDKIWNAAEVGCTTQVVAFSSAQWGFRFQVTGEHNSGTITDFRLQCTKNPYGVIRISHFLNPSGHIMAIGSAQLLT